MLQSYVTWFLRGIRSKGLEEKEKERRDEVVSLEEQLPVEMWGEVGKRLVSRLDVVRFRSVCKKWRSSLPSPNRFPLQVPIPPDHSDLPVHNVPWFITEVNIYSVGRRGLETNPQRVLMEFEELYERNDFWVRAFIPNRAKVDLFNDGQLDIYRDPPLSFVAKAYRLHMVVPYFPTAGDEAGLRAEGRWNFINSSRLRVSKIVLISSNADGVDHASYAPASDLSVVALMKSGKLALLRIGGSQDPNWEWDTSFCTRFISEIATYRGKLCVIGREGRAFLMNYNSLHMTQVAAPPLGIINKSKINPSSMRLFEADGDMYLVILLNLLNPKVGVKVYKLCLRLGKWLEVDDTGNQLLLAGNGYNVGIPRDVLTSNSGSWMIKYKGSSVYVRGASLILVHKEGDENYDARTTSSNYCYIGFRLPYIPRFITDEDSVPPSLTASILSQYDNTIVGRTNYVKLLRRYEGFFFE